jgi:hypothetical protein
VPKGAAAVPAAATAFLRKADFENEGIVGGSGVRELSGIRANGLFSIGLYKLCKLETGIAPENL